MEGLLWSARTLDRFQLGWPIFLNLMICFTLVQSDFPLLVIHWLWRIAARRPEPFRPRARGERPSALVIIPSLLRHRGELDAITTTIASAASNGYPGELIIVASVDGRGASPVLDRELRRWIARQRCPENVSIHATGTDTRLGKMMAVEAGVSYVKSLVSNGRLRAFPLV